ncbi:MAG: hypothetical protein D8M59_10360 [Planctomycetes bacterium]|nr:hypothetical protein [Planctomycetota bacterium]NOG55246.1 hypothetical protein [Planctomycetota bacterium]
MPVFTQKTVHAVSSLALAGVISFVSGCVSLNEGNDVNSVPDGQLTVPAITYSEPASFFDGPSIESLDRSSWPATTVFLAHGEPMTRPVYWKSYRFENAHAIEDGYGRHGGAYPTIDSALYVFPGPVGGANEYAEMVVDPVVQIGNVLIAPIRLFTTDRPKNLTAGARGTYAMSPPGLKPVAMTSEAVVESVEPNDD